MANPLDLLKTDPGGELYNPDELIAVLQSEGFPPRMIGDALRLKGLYSELASTGLLNRRIEILGEIRRLKDQMTQQFHDHVEGIDREALVREKRLARIKNPSPVMAHELAAPEKSNLYLVEKGMGRALTRLVQRSHKFVFDTDACVRLGEFLQNNPDIIADAAEFARPPYPQTWVELDLGEVNVGKGAPEALDEAFLAGILFDNDNVYVAMSTGEESVWLPVCWQLNSGPTAPEIFEEMRIGDPDDWLWGRPLKTVEGLVDKEALRRDHRMRFFARQQSGEPVVDHPAWPYLLQSMMALLPMAIAAALLLLRPSLTRIIREDDGENNTAGQSTVAPKGYWATTVVTVKLRREALFKRIVKALKSERMIRRRHEVRGHYCHNRAARTATHEHVWEETIPDHWECAVDGCQGIRWWRKAHERGDASVGYNEKHYVVKRG